MKIRIHQLALILVALALPLTTVNAQGRISLPGTVGTVSLGFAPLTSNVTSPGSSVTLSLSMFVLGFAAPDGVGGYDITLTSLDSNSGFFIQSRTTDTTGKFPDPQTPDATVAGQPLNPTNANDLGASVNAPVSSNAAGNGTYHLSNFVIGVNAGVAAGTYRFATLSNIWTDQSGGEHTNLGPGTFNLIVIPEPATLSLLGLGGLGSLGLTLLRARRRS